MKSTLLRFLGHSSGFLVAIGLHIGAFVALASEQSQQGVVESEVASISMNLEETQILEQVPQGDKENRIASNIDQSASKEQTDNKNDLIKPPEKTRMTAEEELEKASELAALEKEKAEAQERERQQAEAIKREKELERTRQKAKKLAAAKAAQMLREEAERKREEEARKNAIAKKLKVEARKKERARVRAKAKKKAQEKAKKRARKRALAQAARKKSMAAKKGSTRGLRKGERSQSRGKRGASRGAVRTYGGRVQGRIARYRPSGRGQKGTTIISFGVSSSGRLRFARIARSSGNKALDRAALNAVRRASPFPRPPAGMTSRQLTFSFPFRFR